MGTHARNHSFIHDKEITEQQQQQQQQ